MLVARDKKADMRISNSICRGSSINALLADIYSIVWKHSHAKIKALFSGLRIELVNGE
ncbi:hypothetical protein F7734_28155 [Scytonema sp. UIC 10036]|uniref:hypothetical protein n=1 Tax=Scytonema sp. UIC 10036 TaxID=2304196 RepID=UPI0012DA55E2|nr:hypothetical protein [Scytonema sp. UIC 10036]MUG96009.1 hypothetical protein [Scytonema sp. UIC 10036]